MITQKQTVGLNPGETKSVPFTFVPTAPGLYNVSVDGLSGSFEAVAIPVGIPVSFVSAVASPTVVNSGGNITITVTLKNNTANTVGPVMIYCGISGNDNADVSHPEYSPGVTFAPNETKVIPITIKTWGYGDNQQAGGWFWAADKSWTSEYYESNPYNVNAFCMHAYFASYPGQGNVGHSVALQCAVYNHGNIAGYTHVVCSVLRPGTTTPLVLREAWVTIPADGALDWTNQSWDGGPDNTIYWYPDRTGVHTLTISADPGGFYSSNIPPVKVIQVTIFA